MSKKRVAKLIATEVTPTEVTESQVPELGAEGQVPEQVAADSKVAAIQAAAEPIAAPAVAAEPVPAVEPVLAVAAESAPVVAAEPVPAAEPAPAVEPVLAVAAESAPAVEPAQAVEIVAEKASTEVIVNSEPDPAQPTPAAAAPADANLVPLQELAPAITAVSVSRRAFLGFGLAVAGGVVGAAALGTLFPVFAEEGSEAAPIVPSWDPSNKQWAYVVDTAACIGCGLCVAACKEENNIPEEPEYTRTWIERHTTTTDGTLYVDSPEGGIDGFPPESTAPGAAGKDVESAFFMPRLCMQCANSPCTAVCPVGATYKTEDGVILVDARRCIGCGYCVVACPYGARYLVPAGEHAPNDTPGVADKCTWCYHRISKGLKPACVEVCPVGARKFGDASDPTSEVATLIAEQEPLPYRPEYGTEPRVLYIGPVTKEA